MITYICALIVLAAGSCIAQTSADSIEAQATESPRRITPEWALVQLVPSFTWTPVNGDVFAGVRWNLTPLLYSWGANRKLTPWRVLMAEPYQRHSGSIEAHISPEWSNAEFGNARWGSRSGLRAFLPVYRHGEHVSCSVGAHYSWFGSEKTLGYEAGLYTLFGLFGVNALYTPERTAAPFTISLNIRYF
ncbi:MAG: hypothetical protein K1X91_07120 [Bacteriodetes bacterium]|nr:hypothetical protein [Bacteroidota bacterium]